MGVTRFILPVIREPWVLADRIRQMMPWFADEIERGGLPTWLADLYAQIPVQVESRYPTANEIRRMLAGLAGLRHSVASYLASPEPVRGWAVQSWWQATVFTYVDDLDAHSYIEIPRFTGDEDESQPIWFQKGSWVLNYFLVNQLAQVIITERLAQRCGPQVLLGIPFGQVPIVVQAGDSPARLVQEWEQRRNGRWLLSPADYAR